MVVDHGRRVAFCYIPKISSSTWKAVMANNTGVNSDVTFDKLTSKGYIHSRVGMFGLSNEVYTSQLENYTKFMILRHPFDRLLSAYHDKAFPNIKNGRVHSPYGVIRRAVLRQGNHSNLSADERENYIPTIEEFAQYALVTRNIHWNSYAFRCDPCHIRYDHVIRLETLASDTEKLLKAAYPEVASLPSTNAYRHAQSAKTNDQSKTLSEFSDVESSTLAAVFQKYKYDFNLYGYGFDVKSHQTVCSMKLNSAYSCC